MAVAGAAIVLLAVLGTSRAQSSSAARAKAPSQARPVPVSVAAATQDDIDVTLTGLGTVTSLNTVTVRTRVDGQVEKVAYREGQQVRAGDLLVTIDPRPFQVVLTQAEGQQAKDKAALDLAQVTLERDKALVDQDLIPRQDYDTQAAALSQAQASLVSDKGQVDAAKLNLAYSRITAPISGKVGLKLVDRGNIVHPADPNGLVVITQLAPINVVFTIPGDRLPEVLARSSGGRQLPVEVFDRDMKTSLAQGTLQAIDNAIDPSTGTVRLKAEFPNEDGKLFPNQFVNARLRTETLREVVTVPTAAIQRSPKGPFVYVVKPDGTTDDRDVDVLHTEGERTALRGGVAPGDEVVVEGADRLRPGTKVTATRTGGSSGTSGGETAKAATSGSGAAPPASRDAGDARGAGAGAAR